MKTSSIFILLVFFFFFSAQTWLTEHLPSIITAVVVRLFAPDKRLVRARVVLWSTPGLASIKLFAIYLRIRTSIQVVAAYFFM